MPSGFSWFALATLTLHVSIVATIILRLLIRRRPTGVTLAWTALVLSTPYVGAVVYILVGETWLCGRRSKRAAEAAEKLAEPIAELCRLHGSVPDGSCQAGHAIARLGLASRFGPALGGNDIEFLESPDAVFDAIIRDIDAAERSCDLLFYIWQSRGRVLEVEDAIVRAAGRGIVCRVLVDAVGGRDLLSGASGSRLRKAGVQLRASLPVNPLRGTLHRVDIRNHRKLVVLDDRVAHIGSQNMADPRHFMEHAGFGEWVDLVARVAGPSAALLGELFEIDWALEQNEPNPPQLRPRQVQTAGEQILQVIPSGPGQSPETISRILTAAVYGARRRLIITTPYFVPDDAFASGLTAAAARGVETTVVLPAKVNGLLVRLASRAFYDDLLRAGVRVCLYTGGLLHAKTLTVDDTVGVLGTVNMDRRSFWLNYELSLVLHGHHAVSRLAKIQHAFVEESTPLNESRWMVRGPATRLAENVAQLFAPIL